MFRTQIAVVVGALILTGCAFDEGYVPANPDDQPLYSRLGGRETLTLEPTSLVGVVARDQQGNPLPCMQPDVTGGTTILRATDDGLLLVEYLDTELSDVTVGAGVVSSEPIHLTDLRLRLGTQIAFEPDWTASNGDRVVGTGVADLLLDWALVDDDGVYPLATQRIRDAEFTVDVTLAEDGTLAAGVNTAVEGHIGSFANRIELADFSMAVTAVSSPEVM